jgi:hypothetical protein
MAFGSGYIPWGLMGWGLAGSLRVRWFDNFLGHLRKAHIQSITRYF